MKKLIIGLGILSGFSNTDAMWDDSAMNSRISRRSFKKFVNDDTLNMEITPSNDIDTFLMGKSIRMVAQVKNDQSEIDGVVRIESLLPVCASPNEMPEYMCKISFSKIDNDKLSDKWSFLSLNAPVSSLVFGVNCRCTSIGESAFAYAVIRELVVPAHVREIGNKSFMECPLFRLTFEEQSQLERIGDQAFALLDVHSEKGQLTEIMFPRSLIELGARCFYGHNRLRRIVFEEGSQLGIIGHDAFGGLGDFREVRIPASVRELGNAFGASYVFFAADSQLARIDTGVFFLNHIVTLTIPASVQELCDRCFMFCKSLSRVEFATGSQLKRIGKSAFVSLERLGSITIPASVRVLDDKCFGCCRGLSSVKFENGSRLESIGREVFKECAISMVDIPDNTRQIGNLCFFGCADNLVVNIGANSRLELLGGSVFPRFAVINDASGHVFRDAVANDVFWQNSALWHREIAEHSSLTIKNTIEEIGEYSCYRISATALLFEKGSQLWRIGKGAFMRCKLQSLTIPASVRVLEDKCFAWSRHIDRIVFEENSQLEYIGKHAFENCFSHVVAPDGMGTFELVIPANVRVLDDRCFACCHNIGSITFEKGSCLERIGKEAFSEVRIRSLRIPASVRRLDDGCFDGCLELIDLVFEKNSCLESIGKDAFAGCSSLESLTIPASVMELDDGCFIDCYSLSKIEFEKGSKLEKMGSKVFFKAAEEWSGSPIYIPNSVKSIGDFCFYFGYFGNVCVNIPADSRLEELGTRVFSQGATIYDQSGRIITDEKFGFSLDSNGFIGRNFSWERATRLVGPQRDKKIYVIPNCVKGLNQNCACFLFGDGLCFQGGIQIKRLESRTFVDCFIHKVYVPDSVEEIESKCFYFSLVNDFFEDFEDFEGFTWNGMNVCFSPTSRLQKIGVNAFHGVRRIIVASDSVYRLVYQNLLAKYGEESMKNPRYNGPHLIYYRGK